MSNTFRTMTIFVENCTKQRDNTVCKAAARI